MVSGLRILSLNYNPARRPDGDMKQKVARRSRPRSSASTGGSSYRRSRHQQITENTAGKAAGMELW